MLQAQLQMQGAQIPRPQEGAQPFQQLLDGRQQALAPFHGVVEFQAAVEAWRALVGLDRPGDMPQALIELAQELCAEALPERVRRQAPDIAQQAQPAVVQLLPALLRQGQALHRQPPQGGAQVLPAMDQQIAARAGQQQAGGRRGAGRLMEVDRERPLTQQRLQQLAAMRAQRVDAAEIAQRAARLEHQGIGGLHADRAAELPQALCQQGQFFLAHLCIGNAQQLRQSNGIPQCGPAACARRLARRCLWCARSGHAQCALGAAEQWQLVEASCHGALLARATVL